MGINIKLYNTLSRKKEVFKPIKSGHVGMYNCGPTVYDYAHIGNLRSYVFADTLRRVFEYNNYIVGQVINVTDVGHLASDGDDGEDKMTKALKREGKPLTIDAMREVGTYYFEKFVNDIKALNIEIPTNFPRASDHINEDIEIISLLEKKGFAYKISDGIYFDTSKFPQYGKLGNIKVSTLKEGARVAINNEKRNPIDFCLWKFNSTLGWESPWGKGFPGWHIECSAMSRKYLGQPFDVHTGGIDHVPVHHNNEIAQSEAAYDTPLANYWLHGEHLTMNSDKIAKSAGNSIVLSTLIEHTVSPLSFRYWLLTAHYRSQINFTYDAVRAAQNALIRLIAIISEYPDGGLISPVYSEKFLEFINDDLNTPKALALVWDMLKDSKISDADKRAAILDFDRVFGLNLATAPRLETEVIPPEIIALAEARLIARQEKDWKKSDALRDEIKDRGYEINDENDGFKVTRI